MTEIMSPNKTGSVYLNLLFFERLFQKTMFYPYQTHSCNLRIGYSLKHSLVGFYSAVAFLKATSLRNQFFPSRPHSSHFADSVLFLHIFWNHILSSTSRANLSIACMWFDWQQTVFMNWPWFCLTMSGRANTASTVLTSKFVFSFQMY